QQATLCMIPVANSVLNIKMVSTYHCVFLFLIILLTSTLGAADETSTACNESRCKCNGPIIRFPFKLKGRQPDHCGHPGFDLSCTDKHETVLEIIPEGASSLPVKLLVKSIDYKYQLIHVYDPQNCIPRQIMRLANSSFNHFQFNSVHRSNITFLNCPRRLINYGSDMFSCPILAVELETKVVAYDLVSCLVMVILCLMLWSCIYHSR
ncbi:Rust resistance kinase, partial [Quillaja saponaria]